MGCCISRCRPRKRSLEECYVQDKLVISQAPPPKTPKITSTVPTPPTKISPSAPSPAASSSSVSSFACSNSNTNSTCSSLSSTGSSSVLSSKDWTFSNEFLWACVKENPHIIRINSIKECAQFGGTNFVHPTQFVPPPEKPTPQRVVTSDTQKKGRPSSPTTTLTRQKNIRREPERMDAQLYSIPSRVLRSPSPSRRFNGDSTRGIASGVAHKESGSRHFVGSKVNLAANSVSSCLRKENLRLASRYLNNGQLHPRVDRETCIHRISSKIDEMAVEQALAQQDHSDSMAVEDVDNPLISLDCFIFL